MTEAGTVVDALIGYSLKGPPRGLAAETLRMFSRIDPGRVVSLDVPSGLDATTGSTPGDAVMPGMIMTLALPKTGLAATMGELILADTGIPSGLYNRIGLSVEPIFGDSFLVKLRRQQESIFPR